MGYLFLFFLVIPEAFSDLNDTEKEAKVSCGKHMCKKHDGTMTLLILEIN